MLTYKQYEAFRDKAGVTDYNVAVSAGISKQTIQAWKKGEYTPKIDKLKRIAVYLGIPLEELL